MVIQKPNLYCTLILGFLTLHRHHMYLGVGWCSNFWTLRLCQILTLLSPGASVFHKHMSNWPCDLDLEVGKLEPLVRRNIVKKCLDRLLFDKSMTFGTVVVYSITKDTSYDAKLNRSTIYVKNSKIMFKNRKKWENLCSIHIC